MNCVVINEQKMCEEIFSNYLLVSDDKKATFLWKAQEIRTLMEFLENEDNRDIVSNAIVFILSLDREEALEGINAFYLDNSERKEFRMVLQRELSENLQN